MHIHLLITYLHLIGSLIGLGFMFLSSINYNNCTLYIIQKEKKI